MKPLWVQQDLLPKVNLFCILIDGVEMSSSDLARLQVDDIASFSIMKDAAATALYGARGANGEETLG